MRFVSPLLFLICLCTCAPAPYLVGVRAQDAYFQQDVSYDIDVTLNDKTHELYGNLTLRYTNNAPEALEEMYFHCWPRAYRNTRTAFARQLLRQGRTDFHFADEADRGDMSGLNFTVDGDTIDWAFTEAHTDIALLTLDAPIAPGQAVVIRTPFRVKVPKSFSRLGRVGESYQITQWYPKPAVYDQDGWHAMPYLNLGEYFADFGDFTVDITLPNNYTVGATGTLQTASEIERLRVKQRQDGDALKRLAAEDELDYGFVEEAFPPSSPETKTLTYTAERVHDFAWFADKRFKVMHDTLQLPGREPVDVWAMFNDTEAALWVKAVDYLKRATRFYSEKVGTYPHPQVTGVMSALSVGGGMEYPMITVIGRSLNAEALDQVLAHEVGHNWFQGILGTNERDHAWLDEGLNSYYEQRYMQQFYPDRKGDLEFAGLAVDFDGLGYRYTARQAKDQAPDTHSDSLSMMNYWIGAYSKPALALHELALHTSTAQVDAAMQTFYEEWQFRHPGPEDFFAAIKAHMEVGNSRWFEQAFTTNYTTDWSNHGPATSKTANVRGQRVVPAPPDGEVNPLDLYPTNDGAVARKLKLRPLLTPEDPALRQLFYTPLLAFNQHDGVMAGLALHNRTAEPRRFEWLAAPLYAFGSKRLTGMAGARFRTPFVEGAVREMQLIFGGQRFSDFTLARNDGRFAYDRLAARAQLDFRHAPITQTESALTFSTTLVSVTRPGFGPMGELTEDRVDNNGYARLTYARNTARELRPFGFSAALEYKSALTESAFNADHLRLEGEFSGGVQYEQGHFVRYRAFGGVMLSNELRQSSAHLPSGFSLTNNAFADYRYEGLFLGRNEGGLYERQLGGPQQGGFRAPIDRAFGFGSSNAYMVAVNLDVHVPALPPAFPLGVFLDAGYYGDKAFGNEPVRGAFSWVGGLSLTALDGKVGIYVPFTADPDTKALLDQRGGVFDRMMVRLNLAGWMPWKWVDKAL